MDGQEDRNRNGLHDLGETSPHLSDGDADGLEDGIEDINLNGYRDASETDLDSPTLIKTDLSMVLKILTLTAFDNSQNSIQDFGTRTGMTYRTSLRLTPRQILSMLTPMPMAFPMGSKTEIRMVV